MGDVFCVCGIELLLFAEFLFLLTMHFKNKMFWDFFLKKVFQMSYFPLQLHFIVQIVASAALVM